MKDLTKEQKQQVILGLVLAGGFLYCCWMFGVKPLQLEKQELRDRKKELTQSMARVNGFKNSKDKISELLSKQKEKLIELNPKLPPLTNPMVWAASLVRKATEHVGIPASNRSITILGNTKKYKDDEVPAIIDLNMEIVVHSNYHQIGRLISYLETSYPFMSISSTTIGAHKDNKLLEARLLCIFPQLAESVQQQITEGASL